MALRASAQRAWLALASAPACAGSLASLATKADVPAVATPPPKGGVAMLTREQWMAVKIPAATLKGMPTSAGGIAFPGDIRGTSGLGLGDGITSHTAKWLQTDGTAAGNVKSPMEYIAQQPPRKVHGLVVASYGSDDPALGCPVEYINLKGTTLEEPAICKYTGNRYYSDDWKGGGHH